MSFQKSNNPYRHAAEICNMALDLQAACGMVVRPDIKPRTIQMRAGVHTGILNATLFTYFFGVSKKYQILIVWLV